ncbi:hypothetical protein ACQKOM_21915 [Peribacillus frigoritolerans]|uniref:hypothetical protein n=1 Tax=Peribacillus frigoritolerans TaxID=450367 RepID=UPI003D095356
MSRNGSLITDFKNGQVMAIGDLIKNGFGRRKSYAIEFGLYSLDAMTGKEKWGYEFEDEPEDF